MSKCSFLVWGGQLDDVLLKLTIDTGSYPSEVFFRDQLWVKQCRWPEYDPGYVQMVHRSTHSIVVQGVDFKNSNIPKQKLDLDLSQSQFNALSGSESVMPIDQLRKQNS